MWGHIPIHMAPWIGNSIPNFSCSDKLIMRHKLARFSIFFFVIIDSDRFVAFIRNILRFKGDVLRIRGYALASIAGIAVLVFAGSPLLEPAAPL